jgi:hypothetical protein
MWLTTAGSSGLLWNTAFEDHMSSLMMALVRQNMYERLTKHHNKVVILMHLLIFYGDMNMEYW